MSKLGGSAQEAVAEIPEKLAEPGEVDPDRIHTLRFYVRKVLVGERHGKRIEKRTGRS